MLLIQGEDPSVLLNGICTLLVTHCFLLSEPGRELRAILSGVAFLLAEETLHIRRGCCSFFVACLCSFLCFFFALVFALLFTLAFAFVLTFAFHERVDFHWRGVVPVRYAPLSVRLMRRFPLTFVSFTSLQPRRVQTNMPPPFWILWAVCQYCCFNRVLKRV